MRSQRPTAPPHNRPLLRGLLAWRAPILADSFWRSRFTYTWSGKARISPQSKGIRSFEGFIRSIERNCLGHGPTWAEGPMPGCPWPPQSFIIQRQCGRPCVYDYMMHTEHMQDEWLGLMAAIDEPPTRLRMSTDARTQAHEPRSLS